MKTCTVVQCVHAFKLEPVYLTSSRTFLKWNQNLEDFKNWIPWNSQNVFSSKDQCQQHLTEMLTRVSPFPSTGIFWADCSKHENSKTLKCFPMSNWKLPRGSFCSSLLFSTHALTLVLTKRYQLKSAQGRLRWNISGISPPWNISKLQRTQGISSVRGGRGWLVPNVFHATQKFQLWIWPRPTWVSKIASAFPAFPPPGHPTRMSY